MTEKHYLSIRLWMESLISEREAMRAANEDRARRNLPQAYPEDDFVTNSQSLMALVRALRGEGGNE